MARLLDAIGDKQQTELVNSLRTTVQDQITLHISYVRFSLAKAAEILTCAP